MTAIGSLNEKPLHAALKDWYRRRGDRVEEPVDGFVVDLVRDGLLIEIQTRNFSSMRRKLDRLVEGHRVRLVHPVPRVKWITKTDTGGSEVSRRRSPKSGIAADVCAELVSFPGLVDHPNFTLAVLLTEEDEVWRPDARRGWRRGGFVVEERRLIGVLDEVEIGSSADLARLLPAGLPDPFTTKDLAGLLGRTRHVAQEVAYCLRESGAIAVAGRDRRGYLYERP